jgi:hypothetical protein
LIYAAFLIILGNLHRRAIVKLPRARVHASPVIIWFNNDGLQQSAKPINF